MTFEKICHDFSDNPIITGRLLKEFPDKGILYLTIIQYDPQTMFCPPFPNGRFHKLK